MTPIRRLAWRSLAIAALVGCDVGVQTTAPGPVTPATPAGTTPAAPTEIKPMPVESEKPGEEKESASVDKLSDEELAAIKKLPAGEQEAAIAQMVCPVSEHHLGGGGMG